MSLEYIRKAYGVPAKRGAKIEYSVCGGVQQGRILSGDHRLTVELEDGGKVILHPTDPNIKYLPATTEQETD